MGTQLLTIALATATVVVLGALLVLFVRVRSAPEIVIPEDALSQARARYERTRIGTGSGEAPEAFQADRSAAATRPSPRPSADGPPVEDRRARRTRVRPASDSPAASPPTPSGQSTIGQNDVRNAYDHGDFETALDLAEKFLRQYPKDEYTDYVRRVAAVSACAMGDEAVAQKHYNEMLTRDQPVVAKRCSRYGVQF
jgi:TolA-binding protein